LILAAQPPAGRRVALLMVERIVGAACC